MEKQAWILLASLMRTACAGQPLTTSNGASATDRALAFLDAKPFDQEVSTAMRGRAPTGTGAFLAPTTVNHIPERLRTWLTVGKEHQGTVQLQRAPEDRTTGLLTDALSLAWTAYKVIENRRLYRPAGPYNATISHTSNGTIARVVCTRKE